MPEKVLPYEAAGLHFMMRLTPPHKDTGRPPLLLFLHGAGERGPADGTELWKVDVYGPWKGPGSDKFIVAAPQCPTGRVWPALTDQIRELTQHICDKYSADRSRVYITGLSLGAFGAWATVSDHPDVFAAIAPICGGFTRKLPPTTSMQAVTSRAKCKVDPNAVRPLRKIPAWMFHGKQDKTVDCNGSTSMFEALGGKERGEDHLRLTIYPESGHNCWTMSYRNPELYTWLLKHKLEGVHSKGTDKKRKKIPRRILEVLGKCPKGEVVQEPPPKDFQYRAEDFLRDAGNVRRILERAHPAMEFYDPPPKRQRMSLNSLLEEVR